MKMMFGDSGRIWNDFVKIQGKFGQKIEGTQTDVKNFPSAAKVS